MNSSTLDASTLPATPRPLTRNARKRSWAEAPVRLWLLLAIIVCGVTGYLYYARAKICFADRKLIYDGTKIDALIAEVEGQSRPGVSVPLSATPRVKLRFKTSTGQDQMVEGNLTSALNGSAVVGGTIAIRVDPKDPLHWTDRTEPRPLAAELSMALIFTPLALLTLLVVFIRRNGVLNTWKNGTPVIARVVGSQHSPLAPRSMLLRYALAEGSDRRVNTMLYPIAAGLPAVNDELLMVMAANNPAKAVVAKLYAE